MGNSWNDFNANLARANTTARLVGDLGANTGYAANRWGVGAAEVSNIGSTYRNAGHRIRANANYGAAAEFNSASVLLNSAVGLHRAAASAQRYALSSYADPNQSAMVVQPAVVVRPQVHYSQTEYEMNGNPNGRSTTPITAQPDLQSQRPGAVVDPQSRRQEPQRLTGDPRALMANAVLAMRNGNPELAGRYVNQFTDMTAALAQQSVNGTISYPTSTNPQARRTVMQQGTPDMMADALLKQMERMPAGAPPEAVASQQALIAQVRAMTRTSFQERGLATPALDPRVGDAPPAAARSGTSERMTSRGSPDVKWNSSQDLGAVNDPKRSAVTGMMVNLTDPKISPQAALAAIDAARKAGVEVDKITYTVNGGPQAKVADVEAQLRMQASRGPGADGRNGPGDGDKPAPTRVSAPFNPPKPEGEALTQFSAGAKKADGTREPAPKAEDAPKIAKNQVRELQRKLGVEVDGNYGPETHAALKATGIEPKTIDFRDQNNEGLKALNKKFQEKDAAAARTAAAGASTPEAGQGERRPAAGAGASSGVQAQTDQVNGAEMAAVNRTPQAGQGERRPAAGAAASSGVQAQTDQVNGAEMAAVNRAPEAQGAAVAAPAPRAPRPEAAPAAAGQTTRLDVAHDGTMPAHQNAFNRYMVASDSNKPAAFAALVASIKTAANANGGQITYIDPKGQLFTGSPEAIIPQMVNGEMPIISKNHRANPDAIIAQLQGAVSASFAQDRAPAAAPAPQAGAQAGAEAVRTAAPGDLAVSASPAVAASPERTAFLSAVSEQLYRKSGLGNNEQAIIARMEGQLAVDKNGQPRQGVTKNGELDRQELAIAAKQIERFNDPKLTETLNALLVKEGMAQPVAVAQGHNGLHTLSQGASFGEPAAPPAARDGGSQGRDAQQRQNDAVMPGPAKNTQQEVIVTAQLNLPDGRTAAQREAAAGRGGP